MAEMWEMMPNPTVPANKGGRPARYAKPADLWNDYLRYRDWTRKTARGVTATVGKDGKVRQTNYMRPPTLYSFCAFVGIPKWADFKRRNEPRRGFVEVIRAIENEMNGDHLEGALVGQYDPRIVSQLLGMKEKHELINTFAWPELDADKIEQTAKWLTEQLSDNGRT